MLRHEPPAAPAAISVEALASYQAALRAGEQGDLWMTPLMAKRVRAEAAATAAAMRAIL